MGFIILGVGLFVGFLFLFLLLTPRPSAAGALLQEVMLAGYRRPAHADIFLGARLALPAILGVLVATYMGGNVIMWFFIAIAVGFFAPDFWLKWAIDRRIDRIRRSLPDGLDFLAICLEAGLGLDQGIVRLGQELRVSHPESLGAFSDALRVARRQRAEELAAKTTIKLLFPLALFIAPAMGVVLLGPAIISVAKHFQNTFG